MSFFSHPLELKPLHAGVLVHSDSSVCRSFVPAFCRLHETARVSHNRARGARTHDRPTRTLRRGRRCRRGRRSATGRPRAPLPPWMRTKGMQLPPLLSPFSQINWQRSAQTETDCEINQQWKWLPPIESSVEQQGGRPAQNSASSAVQGGAGNIISNPLLQQCNSKALHLEAQLTHRVRQVLTPHGALMAAHLSKPCRAVAGASCAGRGCARTVRRRTLY